MNVDPLYIDISPKISERIAVFPGDVSYKRSVHLSVEKGDPIGLSSFESTVHLGAHADAPSHYAEKQKGIGDMDLSPYMGLAQVISVKLSKGQRIQPSDIQNIEIKAKRVLFFTDSYPDPDQWTSDFNSLSPELIDELNSKGVVLVGIDTPSVDPAEDKKLPSHQALLKNEMRVLEGLVLKNVQPGLYQLMALPLSLVDADASPVRAILLPLSVDLSQH